METELAFWATSVTSLEPIAFHPAVESRNGVRYWPNIRFATEMEAYEYACFAIKDVLIAANTITKGWDVVKLSYDKSA